MVASMMRFFLYIFIICHSSCFSFTVSSPLDTSLFEQSSILLSVKKFLQPPNSSLDSWNEDNYQSLCSWVGLKCDAMRRQVISVDISNLNISGFISASISQLKSLTNLSVAGNNLFGSFPLNGHKLTNMKFLNISNNQFNGSMDWDFSMLEELEVLDAYNNDFSGSLPIGVTVLPKLKHLDLGGNYFSGTIPVAYGDMKELNYLSVAGNELNGYIPGHLGNLTQLKQLYLGYYNDFDGGIPPEFGKLANLGHLDLSSCGLDGPLPSELGSLKSLDTLYLHANQISGSIPHQFGNLSSLRSLDLSNNTLTGEIPAEFSQLQKLTLLQLFMNKLHGEIPQFISELPELEVLMLWQNNFTGPIPPRLGSNGRLLELDLSTNKLTGLIPKTLCFGRNLKILILFNNFLFGPLPHDLGDCITLSRVRLGKNYLSGSIPNGFLYLPELTLLELQSNYLSGDISEDPANAPNKLGELNLSNNKLVGPLPSSIGNFSALQMLVLSGNQFTGELPSELGRLKNVWKLDVSKNNFTGAIPSQFGDCSSLTYLDMSQNQLSGPIPIHLAQIHILNYFNVSWNYLDQTIPREIGGVKSLTSADFSHNDFSGQVPENGQFAYFNATSFMGNPKLCGSYLNPCNLSSASSQQNARQVSVKTQLPGKFKLIFAVALLFCSLIFALAAILRSRSMRRRNSRPWKLTAFQKLKFGCEDVLECLKENNIIGQGGAGKVYRGTMPNGERVAIKRLGISNGSSRDNGFSAEIQTLGKIRHRNIVRLLAYCSNEDTKLLIYEYMPNGSLGEVLHGKKGGHLKWDIRLKIGMDAAKGLCYLHHDCNPPILHRDVKSNNILLDSDNEAHVADFGLAKFLQDTGAPESMSAIAGSYGYIAPEYAYTLKVDEKSDVYSFGVVLLELITGRRPVGDFGEEGIDLVHWTKIVTGGSKERVTKILDKRLDNVSVEEAKQVLLVGMLCVEEHSVQRPTMREVVQMLAQAKQPHTFRLT